MGFLLEIVTPEKLVVSEDANKVVCPGALGEFGVLPGHVPLISKLRVGELRYIDTATGSEHYLVITGGLVEVTQNKVTVLADSCIRRREIIDKTKYTAELARYEETLKTAEKGTDEYNRAKKEYEFVKVVLKVVDKTQL